MEFMKSLNRLAQIVGVTAAILIVGGNLRFAYGCIQVLPENRTPLEIAAEDAVILYDEKTGVEQFIRQAVFNPSANIKDFGFLVPTPAPPTLSTTEPNLLSQVNEYTKPKTVYWPELTFFGLYLRDRTKSEAGSTNEASSTWVTVREQRVGDMNAAIMQASDAKTLRHWLTEHGYATRPALEKWLASYVKRGWTITAFKIAKNTALSDGGKEAILAPVRMSFQTPHPFYPYQEPTEGKKDISTDRTLRILYIGNQRVAGTLSEGMLGTAPQSESKWKTIPELSRPLTMDQRSQVARLAKLENNQSVGERLTFFEEDGNKRSPNKDLYFSASADQSPLEYPSYRTIRETRHHDIAPWIIGGIAIFWVPRIIRKKRQG